ncbi:hypothetical protein [Aquipseudomonas campi]
MNLVNNWCEQIALAQSAVSAPLALPDGDYVLTLSDALGASATRWEIVRAQVQAGAAVLEREQEGTADQAWPTGSFIYCSVTAGMISGLFAQLAVQAAQIAGLSERVAALEAAMPARVVVTIGEAAGGIVGFELGRFGGVTPAAINIPGVGAFPVAMAAFDTESEPFLNLQFRGHFPVETIVGISVQGAGELLVADGFAANASDGSGPVTVYSWEGVPGADWFTAVGQKRSIEFTFAG